VKKFDLLVREICSINEDKWGNKRGSYKDEVECAFPIEEALEGFSGLKELARTIGTSEIDPKYISRLIVSLANNEDELSTVDRIDKHIDILYYTIGSLHKIGLSPKDINKALDIVHQANSQKSGKKDSSGKVIKLSNFMEPEKELQKIADKVDKANRER